MFNIKKKNNKVVIEKSTIPTSTTGRQLSKVLLENIKLKTELEQVKSPEVAPVVRTPSATTDVVQSSETIAMDKRVKEKVSAAMADSQTRIDARTTLAETPTKRGNMIAPERMVRVLEERGLGAGQTFVRDPFTNEPLYGGKGAKFPTLTGGYYIPNDDPSEGYYLLFNDDMTFILTAGQGQGDYMSVLYRPGSGNVSQADMQSIVKAKLPLSKVKQYYKIVAPTTHVNPSALGTDPWSMMGGKVDWINPTFITVPQLFRLDCAGATIVF